MRAYELYRTIQVQVNAMTYHMNVEVVTGEVETRTLLGPHVTARQPIVAQSWSDSY